MSDREAQPELLERIAALEQSLRARTFELEVLHELSSKIGSSLTYEELFRTILVHVGGAISYDVAASILVTAHEGCNVYLRRVRPLSEPTLARVEEHLLGAYGRLGNVAVCREQIKLALVEEPGRGCAGTAVERLGSFFQVPIIANGVAVGLIFVGAEAPDQFTEEHVRLLYTVANQASAAVQRMQAFLETERRRLQTVVEHLPAGVVLLDRGRRITMANPAGRKFLEALGDAPVGGVLGRLGDCSFAELAARSPRDLVIHGPARRVVEATVLELDQQGPESWLVVLQDVTDVKEAIHRRDRFLALLSHELRNPLAAISNAAHVLQASQADQQAQERARLALDRQLRHVTRLVDDLLDVSRFLHGKVHLVPCTLDVNGLARQAAESHRPTFDAEGKHLEVEVGPEPLKVHGDGARLTQVIDNLLSNARKFTPAGGLVRLACHRERAEAVLRVRDTGVGIPPGKHADIFEPFIQAHNPVDRAEGGLGLGLAVVKGLVTMHDGTITAHSDGPGRGSEFVVRLPLVSLPEPERPAPAPGADGDLVRRPRRVLIVEDEQDVRDMFRSLLELSGHQVVAARNGPEALSAFRECPPEIAFIDIGLPGMDGYTLARALRVEPGGGNVRLVAVTGYAQADDRRRTAEAGFDLHLAKPVRPEDLEKLLAER